VSKVFIAPEGWSSGLVQQWPLIGPQDDDDFRL
jgi:hypothetical protein